jgi:hypothetical protein
MTILENYDQGNSIVKLYSLGFMTKFFYQNAKEDQFIGKNYYTYLENRFQSLIGITYEEVSFKNGQLFGFAKCYKDNALDFTIIIGDYGPKEFGYYQEGKLVKSVNILPNNQSYEFEFKNGVNLTLQNLDNQIKESKSYLNSGNFDLAISILENSLDNNIPRTIPQIMNLEKNLKLTKIKQEEYIKKQEEIRIAEEKRQRIAEEKLAAEENKRYQRMIKQEEQNARKNAENTNPHKKCECCSQTFLSSEGWYWDSRNNRAEHNEYGFSIYGGDKFRDHKFCSKKCAIFCKDN